MQAHRPVDRLGPWGDFGVKLGISTATMLVCWIFLPLWIAAIIGGVVFLAWWSWESFGEVVLAFVADLMEVLVR